MSTTQQSKIALKLPEWKKLYKKAKVAYYAGEPIMTDAEFDKLETTITKFDPKWGELHRTGVKIGKKVERKLPFPMPSLGKIMAEDSKALDRWLAKYGDQPVIAMPKLDGNSVVLVYEAGKPTKLITRGDGINGKDISYFIPYLNLPILRDKVKLAIRCEIMLPLSVFQKKWAKTFDNPRNGIAGILNRQEAHPALKDATVFALRVLNMKAALSSGLSVLSGLLPNKKHSLRVVPGYLMGEREVQPRYLEALMGKMKEDMDYELDGVVLHSDVRALPHGTEKPDYARAWKLNDLDNAVTATVKRVLWNESSHGILVPKMELEPIKVQGVTVRFATANNAAWAKSRGLGPGAQVKLIRSGEVIPKIIDVIKRSKLPLPSKALVGDYRWDEHNTHLVLVKPGDNDKVKARKLARFFEKMEIEFVSRGTSEKMVTAGFDTVEKVLRMRPRDFLKLEGFGERSAERAAYALESVVDEGVDLAKLMVASGLFARGIGERRIQSMTEHDPALTYGSAKASKSKLREVYDIPRMPEVIADDYLKNIIRFWAFVERTGLTVKPYQTHKVKTGPLKGQSFSWTGYRDKEQESWIESLGGLVVPFGSKTTTLFYKDGGKASTKIEKAAAKGIKTITFDKIRRKFGLPAQK